MEVHQLRYFVAVAETGNFSRAAERMHVAQPSLSQQIQKLEAQAEQPLFDRLSRGVALTPAGRRLLPIARRILADLNDAQRTLQECRGEVAGEVAIGIIPTVAPYVVRLLLEQLRQRHPQATVRVLEAVTSEVVHAVEQGDVDLGLVANCRAGGGTTRKVWAREPLLLAVPVDHRAAKARRLDLAVLESEHVLNLGESHCLSQQVERWCSQHGLRIRETLPAVQLSTVLEMVAAGQGISLVPSMAVPKSDSGCRFISLGEAAPERELTAIRNRAHHLSQAASALADVTREALLATLAAALP